MNHFQKINIRNVVIALLFSIIFTLLGIWQLNRASDLRHSQQVQTDLPITNIESLAKPNANLKSDAVNRIVKLTGGYVKSYNAPNQNVTLNGVKQKVNLDVRLMKLKNEAGILVVRGFQKENNQSLAEVAVVIGRLYPRQSSNVTNLRTNQLSRLDPALIVGDTKLNLYDGYVVAMEERTSQNQLIKNDYVPAERAIPKVAGYYWQHLAYVGIWWLFALLVLVAPFYDRLRERKMGVG